MKILDYIYYRLFFTNLKHWGSPKNGRSIAVLSMFLWYLHMPLFVWSQIICKDNMVIPFILYLLYGIFILAFITIRYLNRAWNLKYSFSNCRADKLISDRLFSFIFLMIWILTLPVIFYSMYIINHYNLSGVGYDYLVNFFGN